MADLVPAEVEPIEPVAAPADPAVAVIADPAAEPVTAAVAAVSPEPVPEPDWKEKRIAKLTAQLREKEREIAAGKAAAPVDPAVVAGTVDIAEVDRLATVKANDIANQRIWDEACNTVANTGRQQYPDFDTKVSELRRLVDKDDPSSVNAYNAFLAAAIETGEGSKLIYSLGQNLDEASRIMSLSTVKMSVALTKLAAKEPAEISKLAKPITPVGSRGTAREQIDPRDPERSDGLDTKAWMERRTKQVAEKNATR